MPTSNCVVFADVKKAVSIVQILERYDLMGTLTEVGEALVGQCPIHKGSNERHFRVSPEKNCWNCFGGCSGGNILDLVAQMEKISIRAAAVQISKWFALPLQKPDKPTPETEEKTEPPAARKPASENPNTPLPFSLKNLYLTHPSIEELGIDPETVRHFEAGVCSKGLMKDRLAIPIHSPTGELLAYVGRTTKPTDPLSERYKYPENFQRELELYNLQRAVASSDYEKLGLFLVPDFLDVWRFY